MKDSKLSAEQYAKKHKLGTFWNTTGKKEQPPIIETRPQRGKPDSWWQKGLE